MEKVMLPGGTGAMSMIPGITVCGKTGNFPESGHRGLVLFMAFAPKDNPRIAISVYIESGSAGAAYAAPIASLLIEKYLNDSISVRRLGWRLPF